MWQQVLDAAVGPRGQLVHHVPEIGMWVMPVELGRLDQAHDGGGALARSQRSSKQPVLAPQGHGPDLVLDPVVVDR